MKRKHNTNSFVENILWLVFIVIAVYLVLFSPNSEAGPDLMLPAYTKHIQHNEYKSYNEGFGNTSIGLDWSETDKDYGLSYVHKNSHNKHSLYFHGIYYVNNSNLKFGGGAIAALGGYENGGIASPALAIRYGWARVVTTYPFAKLANYDADIVNIQLMIPLE